MPVERLNPIDIPTVHRFIEMGTREGLQPRTMEELEVVAYGLKYAPFVYRLERGEGIVGFVSLEQYTSRLAEIRSLYVIPAAREQGVAHQLVQACLEEAKKRGVKEIMAITDKIDLFKELGFDNELQKQRAMFLRL